MSAVAEQLRQARQAQNLTLQQLGEITKIRTDHLRALEEGNFGAFAAPVYIRGFVRTYSTILKLDVPRIMAELESELRKDARFSEAMPIQPSRGILDFLMLQLSKLDWKTGLIALGAGILVIIVGCSYLFARHRQTADPLKNLKPGLYQSTQTLSGETLPLPGTPQPPQR